MEVGSDHGYLAELGMLGAKANTGEAVLLRKSDKDRGREIFNGGSKKEPTSSWELLQNEQCDEIDD